jgi:hypothetical protein
MTSEDYYYEYTLGPPREACSIHLPCGGTFWNRYVEWTKVNRVTGARQIENLPSSKSWIS